MTPINDYIPQADKDELNGWITVTDGFKEGGKILGYPTPDNQMTFFLYNRKIIRECGLDFEANPPRTKDAFLDAMKKIKEKGYTPLAADEGSGYPYYFFYIGVYWWAQQNGVEAVVASDAGGTTRFADDKALIAALDFYHEIYAKGYMNEDAPLPRTLEQIPQGTVAMYPACPAS
jgi:ABC-type glycerol-3-phosphate transport system substrate-binding protein